VTSPSSFVSSADGDNIDSKASNIQNLGGSVAKRRKTTPKRYKNVTTEAHANNGVINSLVVMGCQGNSSVNNGSNIINQGNVIIKSNTSSSQHYSGSTSSVTASPSSPPHSHSTEGGDHQSALEICEESDRYVSHIVPLNHNF
jgi:hypothetical protein